MPTPAEQNAQDLPLFVDLDGTLIKTDLLMESVFLLLKKNPLYLFQLPLWLLRGRAYLKARIAERVTVANELLPFNPGFLNFLQAEKNRGRKLVLISASNENAVAALNDSLKNSLNSSADLFEQAIGSDEETNLKAAAKLARIQQLNGDAPFSYAGNSAADIPIWQAAQEVIRVNCSADLGAPAIGAQAQHHFDAPLPWASKLWRAMRPHQWLKNGLLFIPLILAHQISNTHALYHAAIGFICFCLIASSVYLLNDLVDLEADRRHHSKKFRPLAAGELSLQLATLAMVGLFVAAVLLAHLQPLAFVEELTAYWILTLLYSFVLKRLYLVDLFTLAALYTLRLIAGAAAVSVEASPWLLAFSMSLFFGLAAVKRVTEIVNLNDADGSTLPGRAYAQHHRRLLTLFGSLASAISVVVFVLYIYAQETLALYSSPLFLWPIAGLLGFILFRVWRFAVTAKLHEDPVLFAISDHPSQLATALMFVVLWLAI